MEVFCENGISNIISIKRMEPIMIQPETNPHTKLYFLSNLDQVITIMMETVYVFKPDGNRSTQTTCEIIKQALKKVLVHYIPLAGRLRRDSNGKLIVECTNEGVPFVEAVADCSIDMLGDITVPDSAMLRELVYTLPGAGNVSEMPLLTAQVTRFKCGGFVVGFTIHHSMVDGVSGMEFVNSWAETARGIPLTNPPFLDRSVIKSRNPPKIGCLIDKFKNISDISNMESLCQQEKIVYKSFHFDIGKLARLKKVAMEGGSLDNCTSFTVLGALLWRARSKALGMKPDQQTKLMFNVEARTKLKEPLPKGYFGNAIVGAECVSTAGELIKKPFSFVVKMVQNAILEVNEEYVQSYIDYFEIPRPWPSLTACLLIASWTRIPFNTANFGWGEPVQFNRVGLPKEVALFSPDGKDSKGIIMVLGLPVTAMNIFQELMQV
ncbi:Transferase domain-containing protein [Cephalotus follicularis]|uniref:Transferase domain-containing protein n=1 Tax=Cephalotus follicularis TaxID=3775 RepID=A0A1Q3CG28_CEPFO|nr:Transferase domain-containing protein [Cephalotus follicularis]